MVLLKKKSQVESPGKYPSLNIRALFLTSASTSNLLWDLEKPYHPGPHFLHQQKWGRFFNSQILDSGGFYDFVHLCSETGNLLVLSNSFRFAYKSLVAIKKEKMNLIIPFGLDLIISEKSQQNCIVNKWMNDYGKPTLMHLLSLFLTLFQTTRLKVFLFKF